MLTSDLDGHQDSKTYLLIIDPQVDFHEGGSLAVGGATADTQRIAAMIRQNIAKIDEIYVTLDTHNKMHIAHASFWSSTEDGKGSEPDPFTQMTHDGTAADDPAIYSINIGSIDKTKPWYPKNPDMKAWAREYTTKLESGPNGFRFIIWPDHCLIGSIGHCIQYDLQLALLEWSTYHNSKVIKHIPKGMKNKTEMYSAIKAEVPVSEDTSTNVALVNALGRAEKLLVCGQAKSHCVNYTVRDLVKNWFGKQDDIRPTSAQGGRSDILAPKIKAEDIFLLSDGMSSVFGFEEAADKFIEAMQSAGLTLTTVANCPL